MNTTKLLLVLFVVLTIALAAVSVFEYSQLGTPRTVTTTVTSTQSSLPTQPLSNSDFIEILNGSTFQTFYYIQLNGSTPNSFVFHNVNFSLVNQNTAVQTTGNKTTTITFTNSGGTCYGPLPYNQFSSYSITFPDGKSESISTCIGGTIYPNEPPVVRLTTHTNPQAGLLIFPRTGTVYFIVSS